MLLLVMMCIMATERKVDQKLLSVCYCSDGFETLVWGKDCKSAWMLRVWKGFEISLFNEMLLWDTGR